MLEEHKGQNQELYKSGRRFLICSTVGSSSIRILILCDFQYEEEKFVVSFESASESKYLNVTSQSIC